MFEEGLGDVTITADRVEDLLFYESYQFESYESEWPGYSAATVILWSRFDNDSKPLDQWIFSKPLTLIPPIRWIFLKPLTKELWLTSVGFFFFTGFVVWMIERSINPEFQGSDLEQFSTASYFALSTLTFSHGQILRSPLSKIVVVVWCFAVLVLVSSYTAQLSSMIAAEASTSNGGSASGPVPLTLQSFSGLFVLTGGISALMLLISVAKSVYARYTTVRGSYPQDSTGSGSVADEDQRPQVVMDNDPQDASVDDGSAGHVEAGPVQDHSMDTGSLPEISVQIEMTATGHGTGRAL